jgi:hypothetical protein
MVVLWGVAPEGSLVFWCSAIIVFSLMRFYYLFI